MSRIKPVDPFDVTGNEPRKPKLPTFNQYLKEQKIDEHFKGLFRIHLIWFPGEWDNYCIETTAFRYSLSKSHALYGPIDENVIKWLDRDTGILFRVEDAEKRIVGLSESSDFVQWERIGNAGVRCRWDT